MSAHDDGGPAFPRIKSIQDPLTVDHMRPRWSAVITSDGMSMRDYFAAQAMSCFYARNRQREPITSPDQVAAGAYELADAMLKARQS